MYVTVILFCDTHFEAYQYRSERIMSPKKVSRILPVLIAGVLVSAALIPPQPINAAEGSVSASRAVADPDFLPYNDGRRADFFDVKPSDWLSLIHI